VSLKYVYCIVKIAKARVGAEIHCNVWICWHGVLD